MKSLERVFGIAIFFTLEAFLLVQLHRASSNPKNRLRLQSYGFLRAATGRLFTSFPTALLKDESDSDWDSLIQWGTYIPFYALYLVYSCSLEFILKKHPLIKCILRTVASNLLVLHFVGILLVVDALVLTVLFAILGISFRGKRFIIWIFTPVLFLAFDYLTDSRYYRQLLTRFVPESHAVGALVYSAHFLILLRSLSVALCLAEESHRISDGTLEHVRITPFRLWKTLWTVLEYAFYPYSFFFGPIVPFQDWLDFQDGKTNPSCIRFAKLTGRIRPLTVCSLLGRAIRLIFWYHFWYFVLCFLYPNALFMYAYFQPSRGRLSGFNPWETAGFSAKPVAIVMAAHMAGIHFYMLHLLFYGIPGLLSDLELFLSSNRRNIVPSECASSHSCSEHHSSNSGKQDSTDSISLSQARICLIPAPPSCVAHVALYSEMWRSFDRGLYNFLLRHVYHPLLPGIQTHQGLLRVVFHTSALVVPFVFVLVFHSFSYANVIWTVMNFIQLCAERILKWAFRQTHFGVLLRQTLSSSVLEYGVFLLKSLSWIFSLTAFIYFRFGYEVGTQFLYFAAFTPHILWSVCLFFAAQILATEIVGRCGYAGFPIGFHSNSPS